MRRPARIVLITLALALSGSLAGAVCGILALFPLLISQWLSPRSELGLAVFSEIAPWAAAAGAVLGALCAPLLAWTLLRHVSLWRVFLWAISGTVLGALTGWAVVSNPVLPGVPAILVGALFGTIASCIALRMRVPSNRAARGGGVAA